VTLTTTTSRPSVPHVDPRLWPDLAHRRRALTRRVRSAVAERLFRATVSRLPVRVLLPDGTVIGGAADDARAPTMVLRRPQSFVERVGSDGLIGFGESYMAGDWDSPDLGAFLTVLASRVGTLVPGPLQRLRGFYVRRRPGSELASPENARANISRHYDLSNDLFRLFLDETMTYSSALFDTDPDRSPPVWEDLADAQRRKVDALLDAAGVTRGTRMLEIGTGWGELALRAARRGARVHTVTLSSDQLHLARDRVAAAGLSDLVTVELCDYRDVAGEYDAVVSVEMVEAVGHEYWRTYVETIDRVLAPGGRVAIQAITMDHERMLATRHTYTWVQKYIFPGGLIPSTRAILVEARRHTRLRPSGQRSFGRHYAATLRLWDERFRARTAEVAALGFDEVFRRMWHFYLEYSRSGFASGYLDVQHLTFTKEAA
jgi:cyclopropane-fatty-acyl-phospholipid synthase